jgi:ATP synthase protein I
MKTGKVYNQMIKWQLIATIMVSAVMLFAGVPASISTLLGGLSVVLGSLAGALIASKSNQQISAGAILVAMLKGELVKILVVAISLFMVFKFYRGLVPMAMILGLATSAILSGIAFNSIEKK